MATKIITDYDETTVLGKDDAFYVLRAGPVSKEFQFESLVAYLAKPGLLIGGYISPSVASNNLTLEIKTDAGNNPSATEPVFVKINGTVRAITAATSTTKNAGTNWGNAGGTELAAKEIDWFAYVVWDSNSSVVAISASRYPGGRLVSDFSSTTTNEKHLFDYGNFTSTDDVEVCGRFAATLSAAPSYNWSVPTYTNLNRIREPIYDTRVLDWSPALTGLTIGNGTVAAKYQIRGRNMIFCYINITLGSTSSLSSLDVSYPFTRRLTTSEILGNCNLQDTGTVNQPGILRYISATAARFYAINASATYASYAAITSIIPHTWASTDIIQTEYQYGI